jgi:fumarate reductase flavoprotein subunit
MVGFFHQKLAEREIPVLLQARLADIFADETGRVTGVALERPDGSRELIGCEALILACGGFAANHEMVAQNMPEAANAKHNGHEGNRGDGIVLGARLGAKLADMGSYQGYAMLADPSGITVPPGVLVEGGIIINLEGRRFVNEVDDIAGMVLPVMAQPEGRVFVVYDADIEEKTAYTLEVQAMRELGAIRKAESVAALAEMIGAPLETLQETLDEARAAADAGRADDFGRIWGTDRPPHLPYHVTKVCGAIYHTQGGLQIDGQARVLHPDGTPFPNLYAGGGAARGVSGPSYWGYLPAMGLGSAITLGHIAGKTAAAQVKG